MMNKKVILRSLLGFIALVVLYVAIVLLHGTLTDWQPEAESDLGPGRETAEQSIINDSILSFVIWNIGYGGLGAEADFFLDHNGMFFSGGQMIRPPRELSDKFQNGIEQFGASTKADFFLFQEVDLKSKRSYYRDQQEMLQSQQPGYASIFAPNYKAQRVPIPIFEPWHVYGPVHSGLLTLSRFQPSASTRLQLPGSFSWPTRIFQLDRCAAVHRYSLEGDKELVVVNIHNSAYDTGGELKRQQMAFLKEFFLEEYEKGNYLVVGGDWNQCPPYFKFDGFMPGRSQGYSQINIAPDFMPDEWQWVYDPTLPTNRKNQAPYQPGETFVTLIDFYLISPNVKARQVKGLDQQFRFSDHQPVFLEVELL